MLAVVCIYLGALLTLFMGVGPSCVLYRSELWVWVRVASYTGVPELLNTVPFDQFTLTSAFSSG